MLHPIPTSSRLTRARPRFSKPGSGGFTLMEMLVVVVILAAVAALVVSNVGGVTDDAEDVAAQAIMRAVQEAFTGTPSAPGYLADMKYVPGFQAVNIQTADLLTYSKYPNYNEFRPDEKRGWRGPYLRNAQGVANTNDARNGRFPASNERRFPDDLTFSERGFFPVGANNYYGETGDPAVADFWGNPIVVQIPPGDSADAEIRFRYARIVSAGPDGILTTPLNAPLGGTAETRGDDVVIFLNRADIDEP